MHLLLTSPMARAEYIKNRTMAYTTMTPVYLRGKMTPNTIPSFLIWLLTMLATTLTQTTLMHLWHERFKRSLDSPAPVITLELLKVICYQIVLSHKRTLGLQNTFLDQISVPLLGKQLGNNHHQYLSKMWGIHHLSCNYTTRSYSLLISCM